MICYQIENSHSAYQADIYTWIYIVFAIEQLKVAYMAKQLQAVIFRQ